VEVLVEEPGGAQLDLVSALRLLLLQDDDEEGRAVFIPGLEEDLPDDAFDTALGIDIVKTGGLLSGRLAGGAGRATGHQESGEEDLGAHHFSAPQLRFHSTPTVRKWPRQSNSRSFE
jgi:hypothetical protein